MKRLIVTTGFVAFLLSANSHAQSGAVTPAADAAHASQASCVILKRIGRIGRTESRLSHFGISGKQFHYVEGNLPEGFSRHGKMTDHDVRKLQARGAQILVLESHYTAEDLQEARADCRGEAGKTPNQVEAKASPAPASAPASVANTQAPAPKQLAANSTAASPAMIASGSALTPKPAPANAGSANNAPAAKALTPKPHDSGSSIGTEAALLDVSSTPSEAEIYVDDHLAGRTPAAAIILMPGNHKITVKKSGFVVWKKKLNLPSGPSNVNAQLLRKSK